MKANESEKYKQMLLDREGEYNDKIRQLMKITLENKAKAYSNLDIMTGDDEYDVESDQRRMNGASSEHFF